MNKRQRTIAAIGAISDLYRLDTPQRTFVTIAWPTIVLFIVLLWPSDSALVRFAAGIFAAILIGLVLFVWSYLTAGKDVKPLTSIFSPYCDFELVKQLKAEQLAKNDEIARLTTASKSYDNEMAKLDLTTWPGQDQLRQLSQRKSQVERGLARLKALPLLNFGWIPR